MEQPLSAEPTLLIVTDRQDFTADFVIVRLLERGLSYYRLNSDQLAASTMTLRVGGGRRPQRVIACGGASIDLERVQCVWYRRAVRPAAPESIEPGLRPFAASELRHLYEGLICDPDIRWVNPPEATDRAERKVYQLRIAEKHGLRVPSTIVSTDIEGIANFADREGLVICKPISQGLISSGEGAYAVHTHGVTHREIVEASTLSGIPTLLQQRVPKGTDVRVTVIGAAVFAVDIVTAPDSPVDWRASREGLTYRVCELPDEIERACQSLMKGLGITYGAFDFIRTEKSEWFFLEVNPAGEWAWLDVELGLSMRDALIDLLYDKH